MSRICLSYREVYFNRRMTIAHDHRGPHIALECSLPSEVTAISPFVDKLMLLLRNCGCVPEGVSDVEIALREALANAILHGNHEDRRKHVHVNLPRRA
jgi:anti-sigma regulatory factor (Ser/Thr protein kinase)